MLTHEKFKKVLKEIRKMKSSKGDNKVTNYDDFLDTLQLMVETGSTGVYLGRAQRYYVREREGSVTKAA